MKSPSSFPHFKIMWCGIYIVDWHSPSFHLPSSGLSSTSKAGKLKTTFPRLLCNQGSGSNYGLTIITGWKPGRDHTSGPPAFSAGIAVEGQIELSLVA